MILGCCCNSAALSLTLGLVVDKEFSIFLSHLILF